MKQVTIKLQKCFLVLDEGELLKVIPPSLLEKGIRQGKGYLRAMQFAERVKKMTEGQSCIK
jgi:hypothetical protein